MNTSKNIPDLRGIIPPTVTPLLDNQTLDEPGVERLIDRVISGGVHGIFILGTTGEGPGLSYRLRKEIITQAAQCIAGRVPMLVSISDTSYEETLRLGEWAARQNAAAVVVTSPYYHEVTSVELRRYFGKLARDLPLPMVLYHIPGNTGVRFSLDLIRFAVDQPNIIALKDSSGDLDFFWRACNIAKRRERFPVFIGQDHLLGPAMKLGASGGVNAGANVFPELFVKMFNASTTGKSATIDDLQRQIDKLNEIYAAPSGGLGVSRGIKYALKHLGVCSDVPAEPFSVIKDDEKAKIETILDSLGLKPERTNEAAEAMAGLRETAGS